VEQRLFSDATLRLALGSNVLLSNRNRAEYRWLDGAFSWRYRNQVKLERDRAFRLPTTPYASAELFYDSRYSAVSIYRYTGGISVVISPRWIVEPYYVYQIEKHSQSRRIHAIGLTIQFFAHLSQRD
jgi:hypothetical protein